VVCSEESVRPKYRQTVGETRKGDIIVHYVTGRGIVATSRAKTDGQPHDGPHSNPCGYQRGWFFEAEYFHLRNPVHRDAVVAQLLALKLPDGSISSQGRVRQEYFLPFALEGLRVIRDASTEPWPPWTEAALFLVSREDLGHELREAPPAYRTSVEKEIGRIKSESAKHDPELTDSRDRIFVSSRIHPRTASFRLVHPETLRGAMCPMRNRSPHARWETRS
jgi:hypothetical protein